MLLLSGRFIFEDVVEAKDKDEERYLLQHILWEVI